MSASASASVCFGAHCPVENEVIVFCCAECLSTVQVKSVEPSQARKAEPESGLTDKMKERSKLEVILKPSVCSCPCTLDYRPDLTR